MRAPPPLPPYALATTTFRFRALAALAGRAPLGGQREVALASYLAARLTDDARGADGLDEATRAERAHAARAWLAGMALPANLRVPFARLLDATAAEPPALSAAFDGVVALVGDYLDPPARSELSQLSQALRS